MVADVVVRRGLAALSGPGLLLSGCLVAVGLVATWLINSLTAMLAVHNRIWPIAALTTAAAGIAWIIVDNKWDLAALKLFGADYHWAWATFFDCLSLTGRSICC